MQEAGLLTCFWAPPVGAEPAARCWGRWARDAAAWQALGSRRVAAAGGRRAPGVRRREGPAWGRVGVRRAGGPSSGSRRCLLRGHREYRAPARPRAPDPGQRLLREQRRAWASPRRAVWGLRAGLGAVCRPAPRCGWVWWAQAPSSLPTRGSVWARRRRDGWPRLCSQPLLLLGAWLEGLALRADGAAGGSRSDRGRGRGSRVPGGGERFLEGAALLRAEWLRWCVLWGTGL